MDRKIAIPAGIALMVMLALAGMLAIFSYSATPSEAQAVNVTIQMDGEDIEDAPAVGDVLMANVTGADADSYDWVRVDGDDETTIRGENEASYTVRADDIGSRLKVVAYDGDDEVDTSALTGIVTAGPAPMLTMVEIGTPRSTVTLTYNQDLDAASEPAKGDFTIVEWNPDADADTDGNQPESQGSIDVTRVQSGPSGMRDKVVLTLQSAIDADNTIALEYTPGDNPIQNEYGTDAARIDLDMDEIALPGMPTGLTATFSMSSGSEEIDQVTLNWENPVYSGDDVLDRSEAQYQVKRGDGDFLPEDWADIPGSDDTESDAVAFTVLITNLDIAGDVSATNLRNEELTFRIRVANGTTPATDAGPASAEAVAMEAEEDRPDVPGELNPTAGEFTEMPNKPDKNDEVELVFVPENDIETGDYITLVLHEDFQVPDLSPSDVRISGRVEGSPTQSVFRIAPADVTVDDTDKLGGNDDLGGDADWLIQILIPDTFTGERPDDPSGNQGLAARQEVTVTIPKSAGIRAPKEADTYGFGYALVEEPASAAALTLTDQDEDTAGTQSYVVINRIVDISEEDGGRGDVIIVTAKGYDTGTVDFWRDADMDGREGGVEIGEARLCSAEVDDHVASCSFVLDNPPFKPGMAGNIINAKDGAGLYSKFDVDRNDDGMITGGDSVIELKQSITASPDVGNPGDKITVQLRDFPLSAGNSTEWVELDGEGVNTGTSLSNGQGLFILTIPNDTLAGIRKLEVQVGTGATKKKADINIEIGGAQVLATPAMVVPRQEILVTGSGFTPNVGVTRMVLGGDDVYRKNQDSWMTPNNQGYLVRIDDSGNWNTSVEIPLTTGTAASHGSTRTLRVTDSSGRSGTVDLTFPERTVTMTPEEGHPGSTVNLNGEGYPGWDRLRIFIVYKDISVYEDDVRPDAAGRWNHSFKIPSENIGVPSSNIVTVSFTTTDDRNDDNMKDQNLRTVVVDTFQHMVPPAGIILNPTSGVEGSLVTVTGGGFKRFTDVGYVEIGTLTAAPRPLDIATDRDGGATFQFLVPGLDPGIKTVKVRVGYDPVAGIEGTTVGAAFEVLDPTGVVGAVVTPLANYFMPLTDAGTLVSVFYNNPETKEWQWHFTDPAFADTNNLVEIASGQPYWVTVTEDTTVVLNNRSVTFTCVNGNCLTNIALP